MRFPIRALTQKKKKKKQDISHSKDYKTDSTVVSAKFQRCCAYEIQEPPQSSALFSDPHLNRPIFQRSSVPPSKFEALHSESLTFHSLRLCVVSSLAHIICVGRVARKAGCNRWLVRRRVPRTPSYAQPTNPSTYLPTNSTPLTPLAPTRSHHPSSQLANSLTRSPAPNH